MSDTAWHVVTGATSGFGRATVEHLARGDRDVMLVVRDRDRGEEVAAGLHGVGHRRVIVADLGSIGEVARAVDQIRSTDGGTASLVNNAGAVFGLRRRLGPDGVERTMALNHLAPFHLTLGLLDRLADGGRVLNVASDAYRFAGGRLDVEAAFAGAGYRPHRQYGRSKLANILFTHELDRRHRTAGITTVAWSPAGLTATRFAYGAHRLAPLAMKLTHPFALSVAEAAAPLLALVDEPDWSEHRGRFVLGDELHPVAEVRDDDAEALWDHSVAVLAEHTDPTAPWR